MSSGTVDPSLTPATTLEPPTGVGWFAESVTDLGRRWQADPDRPRPADEVLDHWRDLVRWWVVESGVPLLLRSGSSGRRGTERKYRGRRCIFVDNSPAQWIYGVACAGWMPSPEDLVHVVEDEIPVAMILTGKEREAAAHPRALDTSRSTAAVGWKLCHIDGVVPARRTRPDRLRLEELRGTCRRLVDPNNMFLVPKEYGGLGEIEEFIDAFRTEDS